MTALHRIFLHRIKKTVAAAAVLTALAVIFPAFTVCLAEDEKTESVPSVSAAGAILLDSLSGTVLYEHNADAVLPMASTTKIMTALLTIENADLDATVVTTPEMVTVEGTSMGLKAGDSVTVYGLCCGMLLCSGNDAANTAAITVAGGIDSFVALMNKKAQEIGMTSTVFGTPSGLDDGGNSSTARDMAKLAQYAMNNSVFRSIVSDEKISVSYGNPPYRRTLTNHNKLLWMYEGTVGVKTGFTKKAGRCLVSSAEREGGRLVCVTLKAPDDWDDHMKLFDYGFSQLTKITTDNDTSGLRLPVSAGEINYTGIKMKSITVSLPKTVADDISRDIETETLITAPLETDTVIGQAVYRVNGIEFARVNIYPESAVAAKQKPHRTSFVENLLRLLRI